MIATLFTALVAAAAVSAQSAITVNTPSAPVFCQPTLLSWSGGSPPYFVNMNVGGSISEVLEVILDSSTATSYTWITDIPAGTSITLAVKDSTGLANYAAQVTVGANPSGLTTCAGAASSNVNSASVPNTVSATVSQVSTTLVAPSTSAAAVTSTTAARTSTTAAARSSTTTAGRASSAVASVSAAVSNVAGSASSALAAASSIATGGASSVYGASVLTVLLAGSVAVLAL
ncbi:hypothetical protein BDY24DRAFT_396659 [Mrakia frigida]|uniref:uncharacterized protein n=1 Tax=Mrakia frigida TaxID=29902 RepID=UPI003FCBFD80